MVMTAAIEVAWHSHNESIGNVVTMVAEVTAVQHRKNGYIGVAELMDMEAAVAKATVERRVKEV